MGEVTLINSWIQTKRVLRSFLFKYSVCVTVARKQGSGVGLAFWFYQGERGDLAKVVGFHLLSPSWSLQDIQFLLQICSIVISQWQKPFSNGFCINSSYSLQFPLQHPWSLRNTGDGRHSIQPWYLNYLLWLRIIMQRLHSEMKRKLYLGCVTSGEMLFNLSLKITIFQDSF